MNPKYKNAVNDCVKIIAFVLAFFLVLEGLSLSVFSGRSAAKFSARLRDAYSFVDEPDNTIQIACIGNSNMYSGFVPFQLWNDYGYTSTVCASPFQSVEESLGLMEKMYKTQSPKLVLVETDMFYGSYPKKNSSSKRTLSDYFGFVKPDYFEDGVRNVFSTFVFHNRWKLAHSYKNSSFVKTHGYRFSNKKTNIPKKDYMAPDNNIEKIKPKDIECINRLVNYCQSKGSKVVFVTMPCANGWSSGRHTAVENYCKENNIEYIDLNNAYDSIGIDMQTCYRDEGTHLNFDGAKKTTDYLGTIIKNYGTLESKSNDAKYSYWTEASEKFYAYTKK